MPTHPCAKVFSSRSLNNGSPAGSFVGLFLIAVGKAPNPNI